MQIEKQGLHEAVMRAAGETMENMVFSEIVPCEKEDFIQNSQDLLWSSIIMKKPIAGDMTICMPMAMLQEIVGDVYDAPGEEPADQEKGEAQSDHREQLIKDTLGEIVNTVIGLMLSYLVPEDQEFEVGLPVTEKGMPDVDDADVTYYSFNDYCFMVAVETEFLTD
ncbi:MAG: chemotaxis protein CheX [Planctomycetes bacterium]|nr:chemotaxis protein CheX [Planctomycetota bacterium]